MILWKKSSHCTQLNIPSRTATKSIFHTHLSWLQTHNGGKWPSYSPEAQSDVFVSCVVWPTAQNSTLQRQRKHRGIKAHQELDSAFTSHQKLVSSPHPTSISSIPSPNRPADHTAAAAGCCHCDATKPNCISAATFMIQKCPEVKQISATTWPKLDWETRVITASVSTRCEWMTRNIYLVNINGRQLENSYPVKHDALCFHPAGLSP